MSILQRSTGGVANAQGQRLLQTRSTTFNKSTRERDGGWGILTTGMKIVL